MNGNTQSNQATVSVGFAHWGTIFCPLLLIFNLNDLPNVLEFVLSGSNVPFLRKIYDNSF